MANENKDNRMKKYYENQTKEKGFTLQALKKQIERLHNQEFLMKVPFGGVIDGRR